jgi:hypothetical protein
MYPLDTDSVELATLLASAYAKHLRGELPEVRLLAAAHDLGRHLRAVSLSPNRAAMLVQHALRDVISGSPSDESTLAEQQRRQALFERVARTVIESYQSR